MGDREIVAVQVGRVLRWPCPPAARGAGAGGWEMSRSMKKKLGYVGLGFLLAGGGGVAAGIDPGSSSTCWEACCEYTGERR